MPYDKNGREILVGDTLKVFHFVGVRRKRHYMYKYVQSVISNEHGSVLEISHLNINSDVYYMPNNNKAYLDYEIVQGFGKNGTTFEDRPIRKVIE